MQSPRLGLYLVALLVVTLLLSTVFAVEPNVVPNSRDSLHDPDGNEQLLSELYIPLRVRFASPEQVEELRRILLFMRRTHGSCPFLGTWELLRGEFEPHLAPRKLYGEHRLKALQTLYPNETEDDRESKIKEPSHGMEPRGQIEVQLSGTYSYLRFPLTDLIAKTTPGLMDGVTVDFAAWALRELHLLQRKHYAIHRTNVERNNARLRRFHFNVIQEVQRRQQRHNADVALLRNIRHFLKSQRNTTSERVAREQGEEIKMEKKRKEEEEEKEKREALQTSRRRCEDVHHAMGTLALQRVSLSDRRLIYLRAKERIACGTNREVIPITLPWYHRRNRHNIHDAPTGTNNNNNDNKSQNHEKQHDDSIGMSWLAPFFFARSFSFPSLAMCDARCASYCEGVRSLALWSTQSGSHVSIAQLHAFYHHVLYNTTEIANELDNAPFSYPYDYLGRLRRLVLDDVDRGVFTSCDGLCRPNQNLRMEMQYVAALLSLLDDSTREEKIKHCSGSANCHTHNSNHHFGSDRSGSGLFIHTPKGAQRWWSVARTVPLRVWMAARGGSWGAAATLATMRSNGILSPRRPAVAAALLRLAQGDAPLHLWRELLRRNSSHAIRTNTRGPMGEERLLRFERFFALEHSWSAVNEPYITRERLTAVAAASESGGTSEEVEADGPLRQIPASVMGRIFKAHLRLSGTQRLPRNVVEAECLLHTVLRQLRYTCDVPDYTSKGYSYSQEAEDEKRDAAHFTSMGGGAGCYGHLNELRELRLQRVKMGPCDGKTGGKWRLIAGSLQVHRAIQQSLTLLSYAALVGGRRHAIAARYAAFAVELGSTAHTIAQRGQRSWAANALKRKVKFVKLEELLLLAVTGQAAKDDALLEGAAELFGVGRCDARVGEQMREAVQPENENEKEKEHHQEQQQQQQQEEEEEEGNKVPLSKTKDGKVKVSDEEDMGKKRCRRLWTFALLRAAAGLWRHETRSAGFLDRTQPSPRRTEPLLLMSAMLRRGVVTIDAVREHQRNWTGHTAFGPMIDDTASSYAARLHRAAVTLAPHLTKKPRGTHSRHDEEATLFLPALRDGLRRRVEDHDWAPLLVVSDMDDYVDVSRWTWLQRVVSATWETLVSLFTHTTVESLELLLTQSILPAPYNKPDPNEKAFYGKHDNMDNGTSSHPNDIMFHEMVEDFATAVSKSVIVRRAALALQLVAAALRTSEPDGFSALLVAAANGNLHLCGMADYLSSGLWSISDAWAEEYKVAQWHRDKPRTRGRGPIFAVHPHTAFRDAPTDGRVELLAHLSIRRAAMASTAAAITPHWSSRSAAMRELALCAGLIPIDAITDAPWVGHRHVDHSSNDKSSLGRLFVLPKRPFDGMRPPVASSMCLMRLMEDIRATGASPFRDLNLMETEAAMAALISQSAEAQARYYAISLDGHALYNNNERGDAEGEGIHRNAEDEDVYVRKYLVEPWQRHGDDETIDLPLPAYGEGVFFNRRLHRVTGTYYAAKIYGYYIWTKQCLAKVGLVW